VYNKDYELQREQKDAYTYPTDGWSWFDTVEAAYVSYGVEYIPPVD
jgi:hypothetical protein